MAKAKNTADESPIKQESGQAVASRPKVSDAIVKIGRGILHANPSIPVVYMTADGSGFYQESDALVHARTLTDQAVTEVKR